MEEWMEARGEEGSGALVRASGPFRSASRRALLIALAIIGTFFVVEAVGGYLTNSLALLADAGHLLTDVGALLLSLLALWFAERPITSQRTFGYYRVEVLAALVNGVTLWAVAGYILYEAYRRLAAPPEVDSLPMVGVALAGFLAQLGTALMLRRATAESLNVRGVFVHVATDALQSVGVITAGLLMLWFQWYVADPIISVLIALFITWSGGRVVWAAVQVFLESTPSNVDLPTLCQALEGVRGVSNVHDIHVWSITTGYDVLSAHVVMEPEAVPRQEGLLEELRGLASRQFRISHVTLQVEQTPGACLEAHHPEHTSG